MNKLFNKIAIAFVGMAMAIGVGVAVGETEVKAAKADNPEATVSANFVKVTDSGQLTEGDYVLVANYSISKKEYNRALRAVENASNQLTALDVTISTNTISNPVVSLVWHLSSYEKNDTTYWRLYNESTSKYAASNGSNSKAVLINDGTDDHALFTPTMGASTKKWELLNKYNSANGARAYFRNNNQETLASAVWAHYADAASNNAILYKKNVLSSIAMDGNQTTSFTVGNAFTIGSGKVVPTYSVSGAASATNSGLTYQFKASGAGDFGDMPATFGIAHNGGTIKVTYTDANGQSASATYAITVSYAAITGLSLDCSTIVLGKTDSHQFVATQTPSNANPSVTWAATSATLAEGNSDDFEISNTGLLSVHSDNNGTITVTATSTADGAKTASCTVTVSGTPLVSLNHTSISGVYSGQTGTNALTASAFNFSGAVSYVWGSSDDTKVSISGNGATITLNYLAACTDVEITVTASYSAEEAEATCLVSVTASAVTTFTISPSSMNLYVGGTNTISATVEACGIYDTSVSYVSSAPGVASVNSSGVVTAVSCGSTTITVTASDGSTKTCSVIVTDFLNAINATTTLLNQSVTFTVNVEKTGEASMTKGDITISTTSGTFDRTDNYRIYANNSMTVASASGCTIKSIVFGEVSQNTFTANVGTWTDGTKTWSGSADSITLSASGGQVRFETITITYDKTTIANIANTNFVVQKDLMDFVRTFNSTMACSMDGSTENVSSKWTTISGSFSALLNKYSDSNLAHLKALVANATSTERNPSTGEANTGDELQNMLARYDWIVSVHGVDDFLHSGTDRVAVASARVVIPHNNNIASDNSTALIIVVISLSSIIAFGGYLLIKRKEN